MASSALRAGRHLFAWPVAWLAVLILGAAEPAARAQLVQVTATPVAESEQRPAGDDPFAASSQKPVPTQPTVEQRGRRKANNCSAQSEAKIRTALHEATTMDFTETPLQDAVDYLKELHQIEIQFDLKALGAVGVSSDTPITHALKKISLDSALKLVLNDLDLTTVVTNGVLLITTPDAARHMIETRVYDVSDLVSAGTDTEKLAQVLSTLLGSSGDTGAPNPILPFQKLLLVQASIPNHEELERLLPDIRDKLKPAK